MVECVGWSYPSSARMMTVLPRMAMSSVNGRNFSQHDIPLQISVRHANRSAGAKPMSRVMKMSTPKRKPATLPKTAALTKAQAEHKAWLKAHGIKVTKNTLRT